MESESKYRKLKLIFRNLSSLLIPQQPAKPKEYNSWNEVHEFYGTEGKHYPEDKLLHAYTSLLETLKINAKQFKPDVFKSLILQALETRTWM